MGEVYRAVDANLGRQVAIKVLPDAFAQDGERVARFEREAKTLALLNHPNIAIIYGLEKSHGTFGLVMELVEGEDLSRRIARGPISIDEALPIAKQIAEALEAAHEHGVIHRDLKPANIKVTANGDAKVLDFGLAKLAETSAATQHVDMSMSPTITSPTMFSGVGVILGTAAYMSPEQAKGKVADRRADIWAFGVVLFEMLTGRQLFTGENAAETLASVIKEKVAFETLPSGTPLAIQNLLRRCLEKDVRQRLRDIGEARITIEDVLSGAGVAETAVRTTEVRRQRPLGWIAAAALLLLALAGLSVLHFRETAPEVRSVRFQISPPEKLYFAMFRLSPDGRQLAFVATLQPGQGQLWVRSLDSTDARPLANTAGATYPFWSPDSTQIAFFAQGKLRKIAAAGGPVLTICDAVNGRGGTWNRDGVIAFTPTINGGLYRVADTGGTPVPLTKVAAAEDNDRFPEFLPDGRRFLFYRGAAKDGGIYAGSLDGTPPVGILPDPSNAQYVASSGRNGFLLLRRDNTLVAQAFDPGNLQITGGVIPIAESVGVAGNAGYAAVSAAPEGTLAYSTGVGSTRRQLVWLDRTGKRLSVISKPDEMSSPAVSPNGATVSFVIGNITAGSADIWLQDLQRGTLSRFTFAPRASGAPVWSHDSRSIVYADSATAGGADGIFEKQASGAGSPELVFRAGFLNSTSVTDWSADGKSIVFSNRDEKTKDDLWLLRMEGDRKPVAFVQTPYNENRAQFSPDGQWMAYESDETGRSEIYIQHVPPNGARFQVSAGGGTSPRWRRDRKELFFLAPGAALMAVPFTTGAAFEPGQAHALFENSPITTNPTGGFPFQPSPDGQRFLALVDAEGDASSAPPITIVTNWQAGLKK
jgi:Tol biopolymer transport system component